MSEIRNSLRVADSGFDYELEIVERYNDNRILREAGKKFKMDFADEEVEEVEFEYSSYTVRAVRVAGDDLC